MNTPPVRRPHFKGASQSLYRTFDAHLQSSRTPYPPLSDCLLEMWLSSSSRHAACCRQGSRCAQQLYDPKVEQEQTAKIGRLEQQLRRNQLRHRQLTSMAQMARSQASQLRTTLDMLLAPDDLELDGAGTRWV